MQQHTLKNHQKSHDKNLAKMKKSLLKLAFNQFLGLISGRKNPIHHYQVQLHTHTCNVLLYLYTLTNQVCIKCWREKKIIENYGNKGQVFFCCCITHVIYIKKVFEIPTRYHTYYITYLLIQATNMSEKQYNFDL